MSEIICPTGCDSILPKVDFNYCDPDVKFGEIEKVYIAAKYADPFTDWNNAAEWLLKIDNTLADLDKIRALDVIADMAEPESEETVISLGRTVNSPKTFTLNVEIDDVSDDNYEFMRTTECNTKFKCWFATKEVMFGGNNGMECSVKLSYSIERGQKSLNKIVGTVKFDSKNSPERITNPLAE
jgi:hypothetical protein